MRLNQLVDFTAYGDYDVDLKLRIVESDGTQIFVRAPSFPVRVVVPADFGEEIRK